jgi:hypothetical protein
MGLVTLDYYSYGGTGFPHVADDYARYLYKAMDINSNDY